MAPSLEGTSEGDPCDVFWFGFGSGPGGDHGEREKIAARGSAPGTSTKPAASRHFRDSEDRGSGVQKISEWGAPAGTRSCCPGSLGCT
jgi:hypothetical protein